MTSKKVMVQLSAGVRVERSDEGPDHAGVLVCDAHRSRVHRLSGDAAQRVMALADAGTPAEVADDAVTAALFDTAIIEPVGQDAVTRRRALGLAGAAAAVGITTVLLPNAAAAASVSGPDGVGSPGILYVSVFAGTDASNRQFSIFWAWDGDSAGSPYSYTIDPGITRADSSVTTGSAAVDFNVGLTFFYPVATNSGSQVVTATWFGETRIITIPDITVVSSFTNP